MAVYDKDKVQNSPTDEGSVRDGTETDIENLAKKEQSPDKENNISSSSLDKQESAGANKAPQSQDKDIGDFNPSIKGAFGFAKKNKGKVLAGGVVAGFFVMLAFSFLTLGTYQLENIMNNIQNRMGMTMNNATDKMTQRLLTNYMKRSMWSELCNNPRGLSAPRASPLVNRNCTAYNGNSLIGKLYTGWRQAKFEDEMFKKFGFTFEYDSNSREYKMFIVRGEGTDDFLDMNDFMRDGNLDTLDDFLRSNGDFTTARRAEIRNALDQSFKGTSWYDRTIYRMKVARFMEKKYGVKLCVVACFLGKDRIINSFRDWKDDNDVLKAGKMWFAQRVLIPRSQLFGLMVNCIYQSADVCDPERVVRATETEYNARVDGCQTGCTKNGAPQSDYDKDVETRLVNLAATAYGSDHDKLKSDFERFRRFGFINLMVRTLVTSRISDEGDSRGNQAVSGNGSDPADSGDRSEIVSRLAARAGTRAIPIIGWIMTATQAVRMIDFADESLPKMQYLAHEAAVIQTYGMLASHQHEGREGLTDSLLTGSFNAMLKGGNQTVDGSFDNRQIGGHGSAESAPALQELLGTGQSVEYSSPIAKLFLPKASAADDGNVYKCVAGVGNDGNYRTEPIEPGKLACDEERLDAMPPVSVWASRIGNTAMFGVLRAAANLVDDLTGWISDAFAAIVGTLLNWLGVDDAIAKITNAILSIGPIEDMLRWAMFMVMGPGFHLTDVSQSGSRTAQMALAGGDALFNSYAHNGLGGVVLSSRQVSDNYDYYYEKSQREFSNKPLFARLFDVHDHRSMLGKMSVAIPIDFGTALQNGFVAHIKNPFSKLTTIFGSVLNFGGLANAQIVHEDPFGITQYGYPVDDPIFDKDPEEFWIANCTSDNPNNLTSLYNKYAALNLDPKTKMPRNDRPNPNDPNATAEKNDIARRILAISPTGTNGCALIQASVSAAGALFTDEVLSPEERTSDAAVGGGGGTIDCSAFVNSDPTTWGDQSAGDPSRIGQYSSFVARYAPGRTCSGSMFPSFQTPSGAVPNDQSKQYYGNCSPSPTLCEIINFTSESTYRSNPNQCGGAPWYGNGNYMRLKYRNPPAGGNTICIPLFDAPTQTQTGGSGSTPSGCGFNRSLLPTLSIGSIFSPFRYFGVIAC